MSTPESASDTTRSSGSGGYFAFVIGTMVVLPIVSAIIELVAAPGSDVLAVIGKWTLFWGVGVRLGVAALRQIAKPQLTTEDILGDSATSDGTIQVVRELGFANAGMALAGLIAPWIAGWAVVAAVAPALFLGAAGVLHVAKKGHKGPEEWVATITDLLVSIVLITFIIGTVAGL